MCIYRTINCHVVRQKNESLKPPQRAAAAAAIAGVPAFTAKVVPSRYSIESARPSYFRLFTGRQSVWVNQRISRNVSCAIYHVKHSAELSQRYLCHCMHSKAPKKKTPCSIVNVQLCVYFTRTNNLSTNKERKLKTLSKRKTKHMTAKRKWSGFDSTKVVHILLGIIVCSKPFFWYSIQSWIK